MIEHIAPPERAAFAAELRRVARGWFVQTPAHSFPIEPHALLPGRTGCRRESDACSTGGSAPPASGRTSACCAEGELEALFGPAQAERLGDVAKSWVCVHPPAPRGARL